MELRTAEEELGKELAEIYKREYQKLTDRDSDLLYMPATDNAKWWCSCGVMNLISQMHCRVCGASIADLSKIMWKDYLQDLYDKEHPQEAKVRKAAEAAEAEAAAEDEAARKAEEEAKRKAEEAAAAEQAAKEAEEAARLEAEAAAKAAEEAAARKAAEEAAAEGELPEIVPESEPLEPVEEEPIEEEPVPEVEEVIVLDDEEDNKINFPVETEEEPEAKIELVPEEPAEEPVKLTASRPDEPKPQMISVTKPDEPEMGKIGAMEDGDNEYEDTKLGETEDDTEYFDAPKGATPDADTVLGIPSETEEASVSLTSDVSFPDAEDDETTEAETANIVFSDDSDDDKEAAELSDISFPKDLAEEYAAEVLSVEKEEPMTMGIDEMMSDIGEIEGPEPDENDGPRVKLEEALEMPGFGKVQSLDALPEEESVEFLSAPDEPASASSSGDKPKKSGLFGGLFSKKKKEKKEPEDFLDLQLKEEEPLVLEEVPKQEERPKAEEELPQVEFPDTEEPEVVLAPAEEPEIVFPQEDVYEMPEEEEDSLLDIPADDYIPDAILVDDYIRGEEKVKEEELPIIELKQVPQGEIPNMPFDSTKKEEGPSVIHDEEGNPQIVFPISPSGESKFADFDELDFPDATIPESPLPDPVKQPDIPRVEFPEGPQSEVQMNPEPDNKEKARPFRNPGAAKETPSGLIASEEPEKKQSNSVRFAITVGIILGAIAMFLVGFFLVKTLFGNSEATSAVEAATASIQKLEENAIPTQEDFNKAMNDYNAVPYDRKIEVTNANILEKYKDIDLKTVRDIATRMDELSEKTPFSDIIDLEKEYEKLTVQEKQFVDGTKLDGFKKLNEMEESALMAVSNIMSLVPSSDNFKVTSVKVKDDTGMSMAYRMQIGYSYVDEQGTLKQNKTYLSMMSASDDVAYNDAVNSGDYDRYIKNTKEKSAYDKCESDEVEIDSDKMMYYLDS